MTTLMRYDRKARDYVPHEVPDAWRVSTGEADMATAVNCAGCGKAISFGDSFTSLEIHTPPGFGYAVCKECHEREVEARWPIR